MKKILTILAAAAIAVTAAAQNSAVQTKLNVPTYKGRMGLYSFTNPSDATLREVGKHVSAVAMPTKAQTMKMLKAAMAQRPSARLKSAAAPSIVERYATANYTSKDTLLWEGFEDWDGETFNKRPASWAHKSNCEELLTTADLGPTWMQYRTDGYYVPYAIEGDVVLVCLYGEEQRSEDGTLIADAPNQDEWVVSPTVSGIQSTNFLSFDLCYTPIYTYLTWQDEEPKLDLENPVYDTEVLVTTSTRTASFNEDTYTKVFKLSEIVDEMIKGEDLTDSATLVNLMSMRWQHFRIPLKDFDGKNIRVAFRYKGKMGGAVMLDAVRISDMLPVAKFARPEGSFYFGFSDDAHLSYSKNVLMPAYELSHWTNYSNEDATSFLWNYEAYGDKGSSTEVDLVMPPLQPGSILWPELTAYGDYRSDKYNGGCVVNAVQGTQVSESGVAKVGGNGVLSYPDGSTLNFGLGNFDPTRLYWLGELGGGNYAFGTGGGNYWAQYTNYQYNLVYGIANVFDTPEAPYVFNSVFVPVGDFLNLGANIACTVYRGKELENGAIEITDEVLAQTTSMTETSAGGGYILKFDFDDILLIEDAIAISVTGLDDQNLIAFAPLTQALNHDSNTGYAFVILKNQSSGGTWWCEIASALSAVEGAGNMEVSHCIGMNAVFPYLHSNDGNLFEASVAGETKSFDIDSFWYPTKKDESDINGWTIECAESWISTEVNIDDEQHKASLKIVAQPLPAGEKGRYAEVSLKALGCEEIIIVTQGDVTAVEGVEAVTGAESKLEYTLGGAVARKGYKGVTVKNGKKILK